LLNSDLPSPWGPVPCCSQSSYQWTTIVWLLTLYRRTRSTDDLHRSPVDVPRFRASTKRPCSSGL
jgi:hypothetical protein